LALFIGETLFLNKDENTDFFGYHSLKILEEPMRRLFTLLTSVFLLTSCNLPTTKPPPDPFQIATQIALTGMPTRTQPTLATLVEITLTPTPDPTKPTGKIAYVCQISGDQICLINADGTGQRRLTTEDYTRHFYPSMASDGGSVVYAQFGGENVYDIYEMTLDGQATQLTDALGVLTAPEISPDGSQIAFTYWTPTSEHAIWAMDRDGTNPHQVYGSGWDPTWSPNGDEILFASDFNGSIQMYIVGSNGGSPRQVNVMNRLRGRTDWSARGEIVTYSGTPWNRELYLMNDDGSNLHQITPTGGNSQGPSFSPDGNWVTFTAYFDHYGEDLGCEIYIMRTDGSDLRRLTDNDYCDWQPRWGP
jgi:TolB protein